MKKIISILAVTLILFMLFTNFTAVNAYDDLWGEISGDAQNFLDSGRDGADVVDQDEIDNIVIPILQLMTTIASIVVTVVTIVMGIKYMTTNPEGKAKLKQQLIGLVISTIVIWGAQGIWAFMTNFLKDITQ